MSEQKRQNQKDSSFTKHLEKASAIVQTWPAWKQTLLGTSNSSNCSAPPKENSTKNKK
jgi:hypothetical protein